MPEIVIKELPKMDIGMLKKADEFLQEEKTISTRTGLRLLIEMMAEEFRALDAMIENHNSQTKLLLDQQKRLDNLERKSIVLFIEKNPKTAFLFTIGIIVVSNLLPISYLRKILFLKLGIPDPLP